MGAGAIARFTQPSHGVGVVTESPLGIAFAGIDRGPRRGVDDDLGLVRVERLCHRAPVADVELRSVERHDIITGRRAMKRELATELPTRTRDQQPHQPRPARTLSGSHQPR